MSETPIHLARLLGTGDWCSGESMAQALGCSRAAVWKHMEALRELGIGVEAQTGRGYRLTRPLELLDEESLQVQVNDMLGEHGTTPVEITVVSETGSTNADLLARPRDLQHGHALLAERQTGGRGRRGRPWFSPFARNIYLSLGWEFQAGLGALSHLPLAVAVAAARTCRALGVKDVQVKWPNDIVMVTEGRLLKLGGCLVEVRGDLGGPCVAVMGIGLNVDLHDTPGAEVIDQPWTDIHQAAEQGGASVSRHTVARELIARLVLAVQEFERQGFGGFEADWQAFDCLVNQQVSLHEESRERRGVAKGLGPRGGLLLNIAGETEEILAGEARLRTNRK